MPGDTAQGGGQLVFFLGADFLHDVGEVGDGQRVNEQRHESGEEQTAADDDPCQERDEMQREHDQQDGRAAGGEEQHGRSPD